MRSANMARRLEGSSGGTPTGSHYPAAVMPALDALHPELQSVLDQSLAEHRVPGAVLGIRRGDETLLVAGGIANLATGIETTPETLFQLGSISKLYTATLVMQLVHAGLIHLDEPVRAVLQEFRVHDDTATLTITPRQLLSHTSGIQGDHFLDCGRNPDALWRYVSTLEDIGQLHPPDELFSYCNSGYGVLGRLVEETTGDHFTRALQRRLIRGLGVVRTVALMEHAIVHRVAAGHHMVDGQPVTSPWTLSRFNVPVGGIMSDAAGVLDFAAMHLTGGKNAEGKQVLSNRAVIEMREGQIELPGTDDEWGLGWHLTRWGDLEAVGHDGDTVGQRAFLRVLPEADTAIVVLTNSTKGTLVADELFACVADRVVGTTPAQLPDPADEPEAVVDTEACIGIYERLHQRLAIAPGKDGTLRMTIIPDELFSLAGMVERTLTLRPVDDRRFLTVDPESGVESLVVMVDTEDAPEDGDATRKDKPGYVHFGKRAHARIA